MPTKYLVVIGIGSTGKIFNLGIRMSFRSRATPSQRRRRVLLDEALHDDARPKITPPTGRRNKRYPDDALTDAQPRVTDFLPSTWRSVVGISVALTMLDAGITALHWFAPLWQEKFPQMPLGVLDATKPTGLGQIAWLGQLFLVFVGTTLVFSIRRRRLDDLRGTYQVWIWAAIVAATGLLLACTELPDLLAYTIAHIPSLPQLGHSRHYLWLSLLILLLPLTIRILIEVRRVRAAQVLLISAVAPFAIREALVMQYIPISEKIASAVLALAPLLSSTLLLAALLSYARYVKLDALGTFHRKKGKKKKKKEVEAVEESSDDENPPNRRIDVGSTNVPRPNTLGSSREKDAARESAPLSKANRKPQRP